MLPKLRRSTRRNISLPAPAHLEAPPNRRSRRLRLSRRLALSSSLIPVAVLVALALVKSGPAEGQRVPVTATATGTAVVPRVERIAGYTPDELAKLPPETRRIVESYDRHIKELARTNPNPTPQPRMPHPAEFTPAVIQPLVPMGDGLFRDKLDRIPWLIDPALGMSDQVWMAPAASPAYYIYWGKYLNETDRGVVVVIDTRQEFPDRVRSYNPPVPTGKLRIIGADGQRVRLQGELGIVVWFDTTNLSFTVE